MPAVPAGERAGVVVTPARVNPLASLYPQELEVDFGRHTFTIPARPAAWWLEYLLDDPIQLDIFPDCLEEADQMLVEDTIIDGDITTDEIANTILKVIEVASGRRWWIALRICTSARAAWDNIGGQLALHGIDIHHVPLGAWLDAAYRTMLANIAEADPKKLSAFVSAIQSPPPGWEDEFNEETDGDDFLAAMQQG